MNAYELADKLETDKWDEATIVLSIDAGIKMLRQQADRIAELEVYEKQIKEIKTRKDLVKLILAPDPLSDEQIESIYYRSFNFEGADMVKFARAIEEAHGILEPKDRIG